MFNQLISVSGVTEGRADWLCGLEENEEEQEEEEEKEERRAVAKKLDQVNAAVREEGW